MSSSVHSQVSLDDWKKKDRYLEVIKSFKNEILNFEVILNYFKLQSEIDLSEIKTISF